MVGKFRRLPPVCMAISMVRLIAGRIRIIKAYSGVSVRNEDGTKYKIFRQITIHPVPTDKLPAVLIVRFKFAKLSYRINKFISNIPMLAITGFPGFITKVYAVNLENGYWQGMYQWRSQEHLDAYKKSIVFRAMNKRTLKNSLTIKEFKGRQLRDLIDEMKETPSDTYR